MNQHQNFSDIIQWRAALQPARLAYEFVSGDELNGTTLDYEALGLQTRQVAAGLRDYSIAGASVLVILPPGLQLITAFFGVLASGGITSLIEPPAGERQQAFTAGVAKDFKPKLIIAQEAHLPQLESAFPGFAVASIEALLRTEPLDLSLLPEIDPHAPCVVQYTSGSSGTPKGVVLSHDNLMQNSRVIQQNFFHTSKSRGVIWLPPYHDMGLIGGILQPLYAGFPVTLMSPRTFLQKPVRMLKLISAKQATTSGGPNFAYDLCEKRIAAEDLEGLDLSSWQVAFCGAEPVSAKTLERFHSRFSAFNFREQAFFPCYGLAESTLYVTGVLKLEVPQVLHMERAALRSGKYVPAGSPEKGMAVVSCGLPYYEAAVKIVNPDTKEICRPNEIGEVWVSSPCNALGYWNQPDASEVFRAELARPDGKAYLRTGDQGFFHRNQLHITGRLKDVIILNGKNHFPEDIEATLKASFPELEGGFAVAGTYRSADKEYLAVVQEIPKRMSDLSDIYGFIEKIRCAVAEIHQVNPGLISLVHAGEVSRTRNGKIQRMQTIQDLQEGKLHEISAWKGFAADLPEQQAEEVPAAGTGSLDLASLLKMDSTAEMEESLISWFAGAIAEEIGMAAEEIDPELHFGLYGLDSIGAVAVSAELENILGGTEIEPTVLWDYPNLRAVSRYIVGLIKEKQPAGTV